MNGRNRKFIRMNCLTLTLFLPLLLSSCGLFSAKEIRVSKASASASLDYYNLSVGKADKLSFETRNFLNSNLLLDLYASDPERLVPVLEDLHRKDPSRVTLWVLAEVCFNIALRERERKESDAVRYYLSSACYSYSLLFNQNYEYPEKYDPFTYLAARNYNTAVAAICSYLNKTGLFTCNSFYLNLADGRQVIFRAPEFKLPFPLSDYKTFLLCSDYIPKNLSHFTHEFGLGVPLIAVTGRLSSYRSLRQEVPLVHGATAFLRFYLAADSQQDFVCQKDVGSIYARFEIYDTDSVRSIAAGRDTKVPLIFDYTTPFAYYVSTFPELNLLSYMLNPDGMESNMGLYTLEPYHPRKIPVIMVHGLLSSPHTWMQMINTLKNNPEIREKYQFWFFTYSSGNPLLYSASRLRESIQNARRELAVTPEQQAAFDNMVILGHSMGGLISKTTIMDPDNFILKKLTGFQWSDIERKCSEEQKKLVNDLLIFNSVPSVRRIVFLAVPHRGSPMAKYRIANLGSSLITLPSWLVSDVHSLIKNVFAGQHGITAFDQMKTGIDSLEPENPTLQVLNEIPFKKGIPYHSIIGNQKEANVPGGSDGVVAYASAHLDGAESELIVKSGHSVQSHPVAIQEVRRILLEHLHQVKSGKK